MNNVLYVSASNVNDLQKCTDEIAAKLANKAKKIIAATTVIFGDSRRIFYLTTLLVGEL